MLKEIENIIIIGLIAIVVAVILTIVVKNKYLRKAMLYIIAFVVIICGTFCSIQFFKEATATSYVRGEITTKNSYSAEQFMYSTSSLVFYEDVYENTYTYEKDIIPVENFNGSEFNYEVKLNNYTIINPKISAGNINFTSNMKFYSPTEDLLCDGELIFNIKFLSNKTVLSVVTNSHEEASFFEQYFADYGLKIEVNKIL